MGGSLPAGRRGPHQDRGSARTLCHDDLQPRYPRAGPAGVEEHRGTIRGTLALNATVLRGGLLRVGDEVELLGPEECAEAEAQNT